MGFLSKLLRKKKDEAPVPATVTDETSANENQAGEISFSADDFQHSENIYNRNITGVYIFEIQPIYPDDTTRPQDLVLGEFIEFTEGLLTLGIVTKTGGDTLFSGCEKLSVSYSKYGESFHTEANIVEVYEAKEDDSADNGADIPDSGTGIPEDGTTDGGDDTESGTPPCDIPKRHILQAIFCAEPIRHRRKHGRVAINWTVFFKPSEGESDGGYEFDELTRNIVAKTIDISEGGFKGIVSEQFGRNTVIKCIVETNTGDMSLGELIGKIIRCYHVAGAADMYEMTVQFIAMDDTVREFLISRLDSMMPAPINAEARISISGEGTQAAIELLPPQNNGTDLSYDDLCSALEGEQITYGIDTELLKNLAGHPHYNREYVIAHCTPAVDGSDAVLTYHVDMNPTFTPKVDEDGNADFKDLGIIHKVTKDEVLVEKIPATEGIPGKSVTGEVIEPVPGKDKKFPAGKNTAENEDATALLAEIDGFISIVNQKINVLNIYTVEGDVQYTTGNIDHNGIVIVKGDVRTGFSVVAAGDIVIHGSVESASVKAGGTVVVHGGCIGVAGNIEASGNVAIKFIDGGTVNAGGDLTTAYILGATVSCSGTVEMVDIGLIRNSHVTARTAINAKTIGGARTAADNTVVEAGNDPALLNEYKEITASLAIFKKDLESISTSIRTLTMMKYKKELTDEKLKILETFKHLSEQHSARRDDLKERHDELRSLIDELGFGDITVSGIAYEGLRIIIGTAELTLADEVKAARFHRIGGEVHIESIDKKAEKSTGSLRSVDLK